MPWKVARAKWLQVEADRIEQIILSPRYWNRAWTPQSLQKELAEIGLPYSLPDCKEINGELHRRAVVEDVPADPAPVVVEAAEPLAVSSTEATSATPL